MSDQFDFYGLQINTKGDGVFTFDQRNYAESLTVVPTDTRFHDFRRTHALFSWLVPTLSDVASLASRAEQTTPHTFSSDKIR